ncbi:AI-2E family transporter [Candidatus Leptofilum sp.]|uniref:AI-2E family transporter n=1 Tax=Candidatus Leptofilum sp. TaxID=3241576 RepID=UPI003B5B55AB
MSEDQLLPTEPNSQDSPPWSRSTKVIVTVAALLLLIWLTYRFQSLISQIVIAAILAYIMNPMAVMIDRRTRLKRTTGILILYLLLAVAVIGGFVALGFAAFEQVSSLIEQVPTLIENTTAVIEEFTARTEPLEFGPISFSPSSIDLALIQEQLIGMVEPAVSQGGQIVTNLATATITTLGNLLFIFIISIYLAIEIPLLGEHVAGMAQLPGYRKDAERLLREFGRIWSAYLRGQVILGLIIFVVVWLGLAILGVQNSLALGLLSGLLEFVPVLGPIIGAGAAILVAFFQPETLAQMANWQFAGIVFIFMLIVQQLENNILVPRIVGDSLELHPLIVMVAVFMGSSLAGILGAILAAPVVATGKMVGIYAWRKMFDQAPFPNPEKEPTESTSAKLLKRGQALLPKRKPKPTPQVTKAPENSEK